MTLGGARHDRDGGRDGGQRSEQPTHGILMRYFRLLDDVHVPGRWHLGEVTTSTGEEPDFLGASKLPSDTRAVVAITHAGRPLDFCLTSFGVPVAKRELADAVVSVVGGDVQEVPLAVEGESRFVVVNALRLVACLDEKRSEFVKWTNRDHRADLAGRYRTVTKLFVDAQRIPAPAQVFRIDGWPIALIVSQSVREAMEAAGCVGARFEEI